MKLLWSPDKNSDWTIDLYVSANGHSDEAVEQDLQQLPRIDLQVLMSVLRGTSEVVSEELARRRSRGE